MGLLYLFTVMHAVYTCVVYTLAISQLLAVSNSFDGYVNSIKYNFGYYVHRIWEVGLVFLLSPHKLCVRHVHIACCMKLQITSLQ
jgi:hypothetical protein